MHYRCFIRRITKRKVVLCERTSAQRRMLNWWNWFYISTLRKQGRAIRKLVLVCCYVICCDPGKCISTVYLLVLLLFNRFKGNTVRWLLLSKHPQTKTQE